MDYNRLEKLALALWHAVEKHKNVRPILWNDHFNWSFQGTVISLEHAKQLQQEADQEITKVLTEIVGIQATF